MTLNDSVNFWPIFNLKPGMKVRRFDFRCSFNIFKDFILMALFQYHRHATFNNVLGIQPKACAENSKLFTN